MTDKFDITDGRNRYKPCPACGARIGMGLSNSIGGLAVWCEACDFRGPEIAGPPSCELDRAAFDAWNVIKRPHEQCEKPRTNQQQVGRSET